MTSNTSDESTPLPIASTPRARTWIRQTSTCGGRRSPTCARRSVAMKPRRSCSPTVVGSSVTCGGQASLDVPDRAANRDEVNASDRGRGSDRNPCTASAPSRAHRCGGAEVSTPSATSVSPRRRESTTTPTTAVGTSSTGVARPWRRGDRHHPCGTSSGRWGRQRSPDVHFAQQERVTTVGDVAMK